MERFDVRRGLVKEVGESGGLAKLAEEFFDTVEETSKESFSASHGVMTSIEASYQNGALIVDVTNVPPDFDNPEAMKSAMDDRKRWTLFLDRSTGYKLEHNTSPVICLVGVPRLRLPRLLEMSGHLTS